MRVGTRATSASMLVRRSGSRRPPRRSAVARSSSNRRHGRADVAAVDPPLELRLGPVGDGRQPVRHAAASSVATTLRTPLTDLVDDALVLARGRREPRLRRDQRVRDGETGRRDQPRLRYGSDQFDRPAAAGTVDHGRRRARCSNRRAKRRSRPDAGWPERRRFTGSEIDARQPVEWRSVRSAGFDPSRGPSWRGAVD